MEAPPTPKTSPGSTKATIGQNMLEGMNFQHKNRSLDVTVEEFSTSAPSAAERNRTNVPPRVERSSWKRSRSKRQPKEKNASMDNVRIKLDQLEKDLKVSRRALEEADETIKGQETIIDGLKSDASLLQDQKEAQSEATKSMRETAFKMEEDHQKQKDELTAVTAGIKELEAQKELVENARGKDKAQHLKALEDLRRNHQAEKKALEESRSDQQVKATEQIKNLEAGKKATESGRIAAKERYITATAELQSIRSEKDEMEKRSSDLRNQMFWVETEKGAVKGELEKLNSRSQHLADKNTKLEAEKTELEAAFKLLERSKSSADETVANQAKELTERETEVKKLNKAIHSIRREKEAFASLEARRNIMFPIRIALALLVLLLVVSFWK
jgi:chromosome segregation ATPase